MIKISKWTRKNLGSYIIILIILPLAHADIHLMEENHNK